MPDGGDALSGLREQALLPRRPDKHSAIGQSGHALTNGDYALVAIRMAEALISATTRLPWLSFISC
ncbi:hypothetical protein A6J81_25635 [Citrobacter braakii]|nr:hypothetical protein CU079_23740 [Citrobacter freundii]AVH83815.1 hypothetical protein A6J81_25635 [Citrobacter braakii]